MMQVYFIAACLGVFGQQALADDQPPEEENVIHYSFNTSGGADTEISSRSRAQRIFRNPALSSGLASGTKAINRSLESLMETVFYSVLDRELIYDITPVSQLGVVLQRDVLPTNQGAYVVIDRFSIGPRYNKQLAEMGKIPLDMLADVSTNVYDIYITSDATRLAKQIELPMWRQTINNWFGLLPLLSSVLPPAFNANELYDPMRLAVNPFIFPKTRESFYKMVPGGIRSYSLSGGVKIPLDFSALLSDEQKKALGDPTDTIIELPYSIFFEGQHRINVMRQSEHSAWVGLSKNKKLGHAISSRIGRTLRVLQKISPMWSGLPVPIFPTDFGQSQAKNIKFDQLYAFDMRNDKAAEAYEKAVDGDFTLAYKAHLSRVEKGEDTGVEYHFSRDEDALEHEGRNSFNVFVGRTTRASFQNASKIEIKSPDGLSHLLENSRETEDETWDMLVGSARKTVQDKAEIRVKKVIDKKDDEGNIKTKYVFSATDQNPIRLSLNMQLYDAYADSFDYRHYIKKLKVFTKLPLDGAPYFPLRETAKVKLRRKRFALINPDQDEFNTHVPFTQLGRFNASASIKLSTDDIRYIINQPESKMWSAFAKAFAHDPRYWSKTENRTGLASVANWTSSIVMYPLRLFNFRSAYSDFISEASRAIRALRRLKRKSTPLEKLASFDELLSTDYPDELAEALMLLAPLEKVPRSVTFYTKAKGSASEAVKSRYRNLDGKVFKSAAPLGQLDEVDIARKKLNTFNPLSLTAEGGGPKIKSIKVKTQKLPDSLLVQELKKNVLASPGSASRLDTRQISIEVDTEDIKLQKDRALAFVRVEQGGEIQFGRFLIGQKVFPIFPSQKRVESHSDDSSQYKFRFWLTGPASPLAGPFFNQGVSFGGNFTVTLMLSGDGRSWSQERVMRFYFEDGRITPP